MVVARAPYMEWAKSRPRPRIDMAGSNLLACALDDLPGARDATDLSGESPHGYGPLVEAIAARYGVAPDHVATAGGCSGANFLACAAMLEAGDEVLIEQPAYDPLVAAVQMLGALPRFFPRRAVEGFRLDPRSVEAALTPATRLVVVSNPHNPSGALAPEEVIGAVGELAERAGIRVLVDEVYLDAVFDPRPRPAATLRECLISTNSLTKSYGLSSLRCGWTLADAATTQAIRRARDIVDVSGPIPAERLSVVAFRNLDSLERRARGIVERNRGLFVRFLAARPSLECAPFAATIAFPRFSDGRDAGAFVRQLFDRYGVAVVPGSFFGCPSHFRVSLGGSPVSVEEGLDAIGRFLDET